MSHPDEGTIQMLLDGELGPDERARIEAHAGGCGSCAARIAEARAIQLEADRLVDVLTVPARAATVRAARRRGPAIRALAWAASIVLALGLGYFGRGGIPRQPDRLAEHDQPAQSPPAGAGQATSTAAAPAPGTAVATATPVPPHRDAPPARGAPVPDQRERSNLETKQVPSAPVPPAAEAAGVGAREDLTARDAAAPVANALQSKAAEAREAPAALAPGGRNEPVSGWRVIAMEEAVRILDGQIRLIDGLSPDRVETGPGTAVAGADPTAPVVRVVYANGTITLDEQRLSQSASYGRLEAARAQRAAAAPPVGWQEAGTIRFAVTGSVPPDSLRLLAGRVR